MLRMGGDPDFLKFVGEKAVFADFCRESPLERSALVYEKADLVRFSEEFSGEMPPFYIIDQIRAFYVLEVARVTGTLLLTESEYRDELQPRGGKEGFDRHCQVWLAPDENPSPLTSHFYNVTDKPKSAIPWGYRDAEGVQIMHTTLTHFSIPNRSFRLKKII